MAQFKSTFHIEIIQRVNIFDVCFLTKYLDRDRDGKGGGRGREERR